MDRINAIAVSGLQAAAVRASVAADNLVKAGAAAFASDVQRASGEFAPKRVEQISLANGGVAAKVRPSPKGLPPPIWRRKWSIFRSPMPAIAPPPP